MAYLVWTCMDFKAYAHGPSHCIVNANMSKFGTTMGVTIVDNACKSIKISFLIKSYISIFQVREMTFLRSKCLK